MSRRHGREAADAGMTVLELLVVLAISAVIVTLVVASVPRGEDERRPADEIVALLADARLAAATTGRAVVVRILPLSMGYGDRSVGWDADVDVMLDDGAAEGRLVFHGDGTMVGPEVRIVVDGQPMAAVAPDRRPALPAS